MSQHLSAEKLEEVTARHYGWWSNPHQILGTSAWYAPGASVAYLVDSIINDQKHMIPSRCISRRRIQPKRYLYWCALYHRKRWGKTVDVQLNK